MLSTKSEKASGFKSDSEYLNNLVSRGNVQYVLKFKDADPWQLFVRLSELRKMKKLRLSQVLKYMNY